MPYGLNFCLSVRLHQAAKALANGSGGVTARPPCMTTVAWPYLFTKGTKSEGRTVSSGGPGCL